MTERDILAFYDAGGEEERLTSGDGRLEFVRTQELIERHLSPSPGRVLDIGGGPGRYSCWLAERGYKVRLIDPVERHLADARKRAASTGVVIETVLGDARQLDEPDASADAVLLLGPLYHLTKSDGRARALGEALRVLRPGGLLFAAAVTRFASLFSGLKNDVRDGAFYEMARRDITTGTDEPPSGTPWWTTAYFHRREEFAGEVAEAGFSDVRLYGVEGYGSMLVEPEFSRRWADPVAKALLIEGAREAESDPEVIGMSAHLLAVARRPDSAVGPAGQ